MIHNITTCTPRCTATSIITQMITRTVSFIRVDVVLNRLLVSLMGSLFCCTLKSDGCSKWRWTVQSSVECCNRDDTLWLMWVNQSWTQSDVHVDVYARLHPLVIVTTPWTKLREYFVTSLSANTLVSDSLNRDETMYELQTTHNVTTPVATPVNMFSFRRTTPIWEFRPLSSITHL